MDILLMIGLYMVCGLVVLLVYSKIGNRFINKAFEDYGYADIFISVHDKWLAWVLVIAAALTWPITYTALEIRIIVKYLEAKKDWERRMEYKKMIDETIEKWSA